MSVNRQDQAMAFGVETDLVDNVSKQLDALSAFASSLNVNQLSPETLQIAKACLLYGLAVGVGTINARPALIATAASHSAEDGNNGPATRLHDATPTTVGNAAFANAVLLSGRVQGDSHICGHLGGVIIPASLAAIESAGGSGSELLASLVAGYEVALRIGRDHASDLSRKGFRTTPCYGVFGAAVAIARARKLDYSRIRNVINMAVGFAAGLREHVDAGTEESPFQAGFAARNATHIVDLIELGVDAAASGLYGANGFYQAFGNPGRQDYGARLVNGLGEQFEFTNLTIKRYPACQFVRAVIRGLSHLRMLAKGQQPELIVLHLNPFEANFIGMGFAGPFHSSAQTVMSAPFCAALAWQYGSVTYQDLRIFDNQAINALVKRVKIIADDKRAMYEPLVTVKLADGSSIEWEEKKDVSTDQMSWDAAIAMTYQLYDESRVPKNIADDLIICVDDITSSSKIDSLIGQVCKATHFRS